MPEKLPPVSAPTLAVEPPAEILRARVHGSADLPTLIYLPGLHGDWTLIPSFRSEVAGRLRLVEFTYPRTRTWSLDDYARAILDMLRDIGIGSGWLLGESFGSQVLWAMVAQAGRSMPPSPDDTTGVRAASFKPQGLILAGGFVKHPLRSGVWFARHCFAATPPLGQQLVRDLCYLYGFIRHWNSPANRRHLDDFLVRRTSDDWAAATHRLSLVAQSDPRPVARQTTLPVYHLAGMIDPLVPGPWIRHWLRSNCPGYGGSKILWLADHNVLGTAPRASARLIGDWISKVS